MMQSRQIQLIPADISLAEETADYYRRNKLFLQDFEPTRDGAFFTNEYQRELFTPHRGQCNA